MNFYKCCITDESWMIVSEEDVEYIWARSETEAKEEYLRSHGFRKNKKGLTVQEVEYRRAKRTKQSRTQLVSHRQIPYLGGYEYKTYDTVDHYYCSNCGKEVHNDRYCTSCNAELI